MLQALTLSPPLSLPLALTCERDAATYTSIRACRLPPPPHPTPQTLTLTLTPTLTLTLTLTLPLNPDVST